MSVMVLVNIYESSTTPTPILEHIDFAAMERSKPVGAVVGKVSDKGKPKISLKKQTKKLV